MGIPKDKRIRTIIKLASRAFKKYKYQIFGLTLLGLVSGFLEGIGVNALIPLFTFAVKGSSASDDFITQTIEKFFGVINISFSLKYLLIFICVMFVFKAIILILFNLIKIKITTDFEKNTQEKLMAETLKARWPYLLKQKIGYLEKILMTDVVYGSSLLQQLSTIIMILTGLLMYILVAFNISVYITLITLILGAFLFLFLKPLTYRTREAAHEKSELNKEASHLINENILGIKTIKSMLLGSSIAEAASRHFDRLKQLTVKVFMLRSVTGSLIQPISMVFICLVFAVSYKTPGFNFASLVAVIYLIQRMFQYIQQLQVALHHLSEAVPYLKNVLAYSRITLENQEEIGGSKLFNFKRSLEFKNISFAYEQGKEVLAGTNFKLDKGQMVGLIGPSGAGKTTVVDLILRLFEPQKGQILLDGVQAGEIAMSDWRANIGYVSQDIFLINDTVENNIKFYNSGISDKDMVEAAKMANIHEFIEDLPEKYQTIIGERGNQVSAGQRQRIVISRILAHKPELLILDEATSSLDNESEIKIQQVIENLKGKLTVFVIAHRLSTIINSDWLLVLEKGRVVEQGQPKKLLEDKGTYFSKVYNIRN